MGILAHVEANHPAGIPIQELRQGLGHFRLANTRGADEQQRCDRLAAARQAGFHRRQQLDHDLDGLALPQDAAGEPIARRREVERRRVVEHE